MTSLNPRICIKWAVRNLADNETPHICTYHGHQGCAHTVPAIRDIENHGNSLRMVHSFWALEQCVYTLYLRIPAHKRPRLMRESLEVMGFSRDEIERTL